MLRCSCPCPGAELSCPRGVSGSRCGSALTDSAASGQPQALDPQDYLTVCGKCAKPSEDHVRCQNCGNPLAEDTPAPTPAEPRVPPLARNPIRPQAATGPNSLAVSKSFYGAASGMRAARGDAGISPPVRVTRGSLPLDGRPAGVLGSTITYSAKACRGKRQLPSKQHELNDPSESRRSPPCLCEHAHMQPCTCVTLIVCP